MNLNLELRKGMAVFSFCEFLRPNIELWRVSVGQAKGNIGKFGGFMGRRKGFMGKQGGKMGQGNGFMRSYCDKMES
jgi:hypothetical protein